MITLRTSNPDDVPGVCACVDTVARERKFLAAVTGFTVEHTRAFLFSLAESGGIQFVALADKEVVGWCDVAPLPFEGMRHVGRLGMGLLPNYRSQGLGRRLLQAVLHNVFMKGMLRVEPEVFASNTTAILLYEQEGFHTEGQKRRARILDGIEDDVFIMGLLHEEWPMVGG